MNAGAKRELPKLRSIGAYRAAIAHHVKRRVSQEPDVAAHFSVPVPTREVHPLDWDRAHLVHYLAVAEDFREWYLGQERTGRERSLVALLARIRAVQLAAAVPQRRGETVRHRYEGGLTSKQRWACDRLQSLSEQGHKTVAYAEFPALLEILAAELTHRGIAHVLLHGGKPVAQRTRELERHFRFGPAPVLLATTGVAQKGLNIHQADRALLLTRAWTAKTEAQADGRLLRPQQRRAVHVDCPELDGSIDAYQRQMVEAKADAIRTGLDWGAPQAREVEFLHLDTILHRFCVDLAARFGIETRQLRARLAA
jgi:hypothetical protein